MTTAAPSTTRPPEFDARLVSYLPALRKHARRLSFQHCEELLQDTIATALTRWQTFRNDGAYTGFYSWLRWKMRGVRRNQAAKKRLVIIDADITRLSLPATQYDSAEASAVIGRLAGRSGVALARLGMGETLQEIATDMRLSRERVRQITDTERERLRRSLNNVAVLVSQSRIAA